MLPPVESDETLVATGIYLKIQKGKNTRLQETWSLHALPDTAQIWRSQLLFNEAALISSCYLLRAPDGRPVQMMFYWRWPDGRDDFVEYRFNERHAKVVYRGHEQDMILPVPYVVYGWHTVTENFLWWRYDRRIGGSQAFNIVAPGIQTGTVKPSLMTMSARLAQTQILSGPSGPARGYVFAIDMPEIGAQQMWFDEYGVPMRWDLPSEALTVELAEYVRVQ